MPETKTSLRIVLTSEDVSVLLLHVNEETYFVVTRNIRDDATSNRYNE